MTGESNSKIIRVGSRKSELALIQTKYVISCLQKMNSDVQFEIHTMTTIGDRVLNKSLPKIGEKSLFTKDLEDALRTGGVDFVVHSLKDLPTALPVGMAIGAVLAREDPRDALVLNAKHHGKTLTSLQKGAVVGTSSLRRSAQLARYYPHLLICDIRGNLNTRLAKLDAENSKFAGIILAQAGLVRMGWDKRINQVIDPSEILYAVGQGALAVECRSNDAYILAMLAKLCHLETQCKILVERSFLKTLGGGCSAPVAVSTNLKRKPDSKSSQINIQGAVWSLDGRTEIRADAACSLILNDEKEAVQQDIENGNDIPAKRSRSNEAIIDNDVKTNSPSPPPAKCPIDLKRKSPEVVDHAEPSCSQSEKLDLKQFISVHGAMFKKCPYSTEIEKFAEVSTLPEKGQGDSRDSDPCPSVTFPVGVDFMGNCPFVSTEQKVDQLGQDEIKCPLNSQVQTGTVPLEPSTASSCPFLSQQAKILDYNENLHRTIIAPNLENNSDQLFCGMFRHNHVKKEIFVECEQLGITLAKLLISKGALDVMKCAQNEIHSKA